MLCQPWKMILCLLAMGAPVYAQQGASTRSVKVGGDALTQPAERLPMHFQGTRQATSRVDNSQAIPPLATSVTRRPASPPQQRVAGGAGEPALAVRKRDDAIQVAEKRVEFAREQMAQLENYNRWSPADAQPPMAVRVMPHSDSYAPVSVTDPVQAFEPRSTFAHVLIAAENELADSELQLQELVAERNSKPAGQTAGGEATTSASASDPELRLAELEAKLRRERFMADSAEARLIQLSNLSSLTYSGTYESLYRKLELKRLEHELAVQTLEAEQTSLANGGSR